MRIHLTPSVTSPASHAASAPKPPAETTFAQALAEASREAAAPPAPPPSLKSKGLPSLFGHAGDDGIITGDELRMALGEAKVRYQNRLISALSAAGIDTSAPLKLEVDTAGRIVVAGAHPDKARIEALFAEDGQLAGAFKEVMALSNLIARGEEAIAFQAAYAKDPKAAVARYAHLFNTSVQVSMTHRWGSDGLELFFESERTPNLAWG